MEKSRELFTNEQEMTSRVTVVQGQRYQGYPYTNPMVTDAPSLDPETAAKWSNLPRKQLVPARKPSVPDPVVYIDIPDNGATSNSSNNSEESPRQNISNLGRPEAKEPEDSPVVYIDLPDTEVPSTPSRSEDRRREGDGSSENSPDFVEETIFYDPFEDRRIDVNREPGPSTAGTSSSQSGSSSSVPESRFTSKETFVYGSTQPPQNYPSPLPPLIPVTEFPKPPPAYSETDPTVREPPPRTQVIVPNPQAPIGIAGSDRKLVSCPNCGVRVHTLVVRENACITHIIAIILLLFCFPLGILIYCTDYCKYRNHYCPNCNRLIGYEIPFLCQEMTYAKPV